MIYRKFASNDLRFDPQSKEYLGPALSQRTTETEINLAYGKMALFTGNKEVLDKFQQIHSTQFSPGNIGDFVSLIRRDLGFGDPAISPELFPYVIGAERAKQVIGDA